MFLTYISKALKTLSLILGWNPYQHGTQVRLSDHITMDPQQVGQSPLALPLAATETHVFQHYKMYI